MWQVLRSNRLSTRLFANRKAIVDAACEACKKLVAQPQTIPSIGLRAGAQT